MEMQAELDSVDAQILDLLQRDARITMRALGLAVGLSGPAVTDRVRRLEDRGVVRGYHADVSSERLGLPVVAFVTLGAPYEEHGARRFESQIHEITEAAECYRVSGEDQYLVKVFAASIPALQEVIDRMRGFSRVRSTLILSTIKHDDRLRPPPRIGAQPVFHHGAD
jgi:Lrp/AsnC family transcriptional regulator, leucine-responsive regulatory protein